MPSVAQLESQPTAAAKTVAARSAKGRQPPGPSRGDDHRCLLPKIATPVAGEARRSVICASETIAAVAAEEGERERDQAERERLGAGSGR
jgi:hypothetical protein